jgi:hypothetical protein
LSSKIKLKMKPETCIFRYYSLALNNFLKIFPASDFGIASTNTTPPRNFLYDDVFFSAHSTSSAKNRTEQNRTEQNRTEQNRTEQNRTEQKRKEKKRREEKRRKKRTVSEKKKKVRNKETIVKGRKCGETKERTYLLQ